MSNACLDCLTWARLLEALSPRVQQIVDKSTRPARELLARPADELLLAAGVSDTEHDGWLAAAAAAARVDARTERDGGAVCLHSDSYPERLRELDDAPRALFHTGPLDRLKRLLAEESVAIVGSRRPSDSGRQAAFELGRGLAAAGVTVISGMALGIDGACHRGALERGTGVIAVLASGADRASPATHRALHSEISAVGTIVSEMPWGARPLPWLFPARNRIMAALATITIVVEAAERSGSLITADFAEQLQRTVAAMPGAPGARLTAGNNALLRDGATPVRGAQDVLDDLYGVSEATARQADAARSRVAGDPALGALLDAIEVGASIEQMAARSGLGARELRVALARLERSGLVRRSGLGGYVATAGGG